MKEMGNSSRSAFHPLEGFKPTSLSFQSAKMFNYAGWRRTCNFIFTIFAAVFIVTRLVILPFWYKCRFRLSHFLPAKTVGDLFTDSQALR